MIIYLDENLPPHLAKGFQQFQGPEGKRIGVKMEIRYLPDDFGRGIKDEDWIPKVGQLKACVITQDRNIHSRKHEMQLYRAYKVGMFFLRPRSKKRGMSVWEMVENLARNWPAIVKCIQREKRPFAYEVRVDKGLVLIEP